MWPTLVIEPDIISARTFVQRACEAVEYDNYNPLCVWNSFDAIVGPHIPTLRQILAYFHKRVTEVKFQQAIISLWLQRAATFGADYAIRRELPAARAQESELYVAFCAGRHRKARRWTGALELRAEIAGRVAELHRERKALGQSEFEKMKIMEESASSRENMQNNGWIG